MKKWLVSVEAFDDIHKAYIDAESKMEAINKGVMTICEDLNISTDDVTSMSAEGIVLADPQSLPNPDIAKLEAKVDQLHVMITKGFDRLARLVDQLNDTIVEMIESEEELGEISVDDITIDDLKNSNQG